MLLREVGFWCEPTGARDSDSAAHESEPLKAQDSLAVARAAAETDDRRSVEARPDPTKLVDHTWFMTHSGLVSMLEWYLVDGAFIESHELAYSYCRFPKCSVAKYKPSTMGACTLTDGMYCWPEGYWHYIRHHHVRPPQDFLDHVSANYRRAILAAKALSREHGEDVLFGWDPQTRGPVPLPSVTQAWILDNCTLRLPSDAKKTPPAETHSWDLLACSPSSCCAGATPSACSLS
ncbi:hypothetical protein ATCC90586_000305 [Pythium insidiosum]|nr:hypothetical protein ATCC90586_000305 [Pythium insidiosum]